MSGKHYLESELEDLLQSDNRLWRFLQAGSLDGCWYWDLERPEREWMSPEFWRLFGIDPTTKRHDPAEWQDIIFAEDLEVALQNFNRHCEDPTHPYDQTVRYRHADGSTVWVRCRGIAIRDASGKPVRMLGAHNDLTAVKRAEQQALDDKRRVESANEELQAFSYAISHDMKAPSNTLHSLLTELKGCCADSLGQDEQELIDLSLNTVNRMSRLIDDLVAYNNAMDRELEMQAIDVKKLVEEVAADHADAVRTADASFQTEAIPRIVGNPYQIRMLFQNLIGNALKYRAASRPLEVVVSAESDEQQNKARITVRDNGVGIAAADQRCVFELFRRLHRYDEIPGTGLGLALCKRIAANHGSDIDLQSTVGEGAAFSVSLDLA